MNMNVESQMDTILKLIANTFEACKDMEDLKRAVQALNAISKRNISENDENQMDTILKLVSGKFESCEDMESVKKIVQEIRIISEKDKIAEFNNKIQYLSGARENKLSDNTAP